MAKLSAFSVRDVAADNFGSPFFVQHVGIAVRGFTDEVNNFRDGNNNLYNHPKDFSLYEIGSFDQDTGTLEAFDTPKLIAHATTLKNQAVAV